jgi:hypothetical protein
MKIESMPNHISMNITTQKQTQGKSFGEKVASGISTAGALVGGVMTNSPIISAAVNGVGLLSGASAASYAATGVVSLGGAAAPAATTIGSGNASGPNLLGGASTNGIGQYNTSIAEMSAQNAQMLQVQMAMQRENTMFSSISNVLKTKHDTAKNSISNIR